MTYKEAYDIMQEVKIRMTVGKPNWELEDVFDRALQALQFFAHMEECKM